MSYINNGYADDQKEFIHIRVAMYPKILTILGDSKVPKKPEKQYKKIKDQFSQSDH